MKKFKLITLWASSVPITSLMVLSAACDNSQEPGKNQNLMIMTQ